MLRPDEDAINMESFHSFEFRGHFFGNQKMLGCLLDNREAGNTLSHE